MHGVPFPPSWSLSCPPGPSLTPGVSLPSSGSLHTKGLSPVPGDSPGLWGPPTPVPGVPPGAQGPSPILRVPSWSQGGPPTPGFFSCPWGLSWPLGSPHPCPQGPSWCPRSFSHLWGSLSCPQGPSLTPGLAPIPQVPPQSLGSLCLVPGLPLSRWVPPVSLRCPQGPSQGVSRGDKWGVTDHGPSPCPRHRPRQLVHL